MKPLFGGAAFAAAILTTSVIFYSRPSAAEPNANQEPSTKEKSNQAIEDQKKRSELPPPVDLEMLEAGAIPSERPIKIPQSRPTLLEFADPPFMERRGALESFQHYMATAYCLGGRTAS